MQVFFNRFFSVVLNIVVLSAKELLKCIVLYWLNLVLKVDRRSMAAEFALFAVYG